MRRPHLASGRRRGAAVPSAAIGLFWVLFAFAACKGQVSAVDARPAASEGGGIRFPDLSLLDGRHGESSRGPDRTKPDRSALDGTARDGPPSHDGASKHDGSPNHDVLAVDSKKAADARAPDAKVTAAELCGTADEGAAVNLSCPTGLVIRQVVFASFGTPTGSCGAFAVDGSCDAPGAAAVVAAACLNQPSCVVSADNGTFGDPCFGTVKRLYVEVTCSS